MLIITSWNRYYYYYPRVTEETETASGGLGMYPQSHNWKWWIWDSRMVNLTPEPRSLSTPWYCLGKLLSMQVLCTFWLLLLLLSQIGLPYLRKLVHFSFKSFFKDECKVLDNTGKSLEALYFVHKCVTRTKLTHMYSIGSLLSAASF